MKRIFYFLIFVFIVACNNEKNTSNKKSTCGDPAYDEFMDSLKNDKGFQNTLKNTSKKAFIQEMYRQIEWFGKEKYNNILWDLAIVFNPRRSFCGYNDINIYRKNFKESQGFRFFCIRQTFDRSAESLKTLFDEDTKSLIVETLKSEYDYFKFYESTGLSDLVKALIVAYKEIGNNEELLNQLYQRAETNDVLYDEVYTDLISEDVVKLIGEDYSEDPLIMGFIRYRWVYSFWVRRHHENNKEYVFELLKEFHERMTTEEMGC